VELGFAGYDGISLPFAEESQDAVWASFCIHQIVELSSAIREWFRVLKPGGFLVISCSITGATLQNASVQSGVKPAAGKSSGIGLSKFFGMVDDALRTDICRIFHCGQSEPVSATVDNQEILKSEIDLVLQKLVSNEQIDSGVSV
jgi:SAM-dependent methyltransferase